jgi:hypothetical protein
VVTVSQIEKYLETYSLEEILEFNEVTEAEVLLHLVEEQVLQLPIPPVDLDD